jgi:hypothetical protein
MPKKRVSKKNMNKKRVSKRVSKNVKKRVSKSKKQKGGKLNAFFKLMLDARKQDLSEFKYNGNTYKQITAKTGLKLYKKA